MFIRVALLFLFLNSFSSFCQTDSTSKESFPNRVFFDVSHTGRAILHVYKKPFSWKKKEWLTFGGVMGGAVAVSFLDEPINNYFKRNKTHFQNQVASFGDMMGQPEYQGPLLVGLWGIGVSINNDWLRTTSSMLAASMAASGLMQSFSKDAVGRSRPSKGVGNKSFKPFGGPSFHSFPSGHTMLSVSSSWILARQINFIPLKVVFYTIPAIVGWSRLYDNAHWFSDIILGSALGIASAEAVIQYYNSIKKKDNNQAGLSILPKGNGMTIAYRF